MLDGVVVILAALLVLWLQAQFLDTRRLHVDGLGGVLNDQVDYISVARNLAETGTLAGNTIYPSTLGQHASRTYLYMPGHFFALAASYRVFGFGPLPSLLPNMISFVLTALLLFVAGCALYDRQTGFLAAFLFLLLPANMFFAETAMSELTLVAASTAALVVFVRLPSRLRPYTAPFLLVVPFLFRETAALLVIPMAFLVLLDDGRWNFVPALVLSLASVVVLTAVFRLDFSAGRPALNSIQYGEGLAMYRDATLPSHPIGAQTLFEAVFRNVAANLGRFAILVRSDAAGMEGFSILTVVVATAVVATYAVSRGRADPLSLGATALVLTVFGAIMGLYRLDLYRGVRVLLFVYPLLALCVARACRVWVFGCAGRKGATAKASLFAALVVFAVLGLHAAAAAGGSLERDDREDDALAALMNGIGHDDRQLLVAPYWLAMPYVVAHHPVKWSFVPANAATLDLLRERFEIGTFILPLNDDTSSISTADLERIGLVPTREFMHGAIRYVVAKRP